MNAKHAKIKTAKEPAKSPSKKGLSVGETLRLPESEAKSIRAAQQGVENLQTTFGAKREEYLQLELQIMQALNKGRQEVQALVSAAAEKSGIELGKDGAQYNFDVSSLTFTRVK